jgi:ADP-ribose pyrophosphatase YjhB (NUDIX family)
VAVPPDRLRWARKLQAVAQSGLTYTESAFERERFEAVRAIAAEIAASTDGDEPAQVLARFADEHGYATPKVDVRGVVVHEGHVLLVREVGDTRWTLPGGWADVGETPRQAVEKEVREEAGLAVRAVRVLAVYDRDFRGRPRWPAHCYKLYVLCEADAGAPAGDGLETEEAAFFDPATLPELSVKTPDEHLRRVLAIAADPTLGADLD